MLDRLAAFLENNYLASIRYLSVEQPLTVVVRANRIMVAQLPGM
jgi:hypothetical protein